MSTMVFKTVWQEIKFNSKKLLKKDTKKKFLDQEHNLKQVDSVVLYLQNFEDLFSLIFTINLIFLN